MRKIFKFEAWFYISGILTIGVILFWWWRFFLSRNFDVDELAHLHWAWLQFKGQRPYVDFFYVLPPFFNLLFYPLFLVFKESVSALIWMRVLSFLIYLLVAGGVFLLGSESFGKRVGVLSVVVFLSLPIGLAKQLEMRPDNLSVAFFVLGLWAFFRGFFNNKNKWFFWAGLFLGINAVIIQKGVLSVALVLGLAVMSVGSERRRDFLKIILGLITPFFLLVLYLGMRGLLVEGLEAMVRLAPLTNEGIYKTSFSWYLRPNNIYYGGYGSHKNFPWYFNRLLFLLAGMAIVFWLGRALVSRRLGKKSGAGLVLGFLAFFLIYFNEALGATFLQYYLPVFPLVAIVVAGGILGLLKFLKLENWLGLVVVVAFLGLSLFSCKKSLVGRGGWSNEEHLALISDYLKVSGPEDRVFDFWGFYVFRPDGYFVCCNDFPAFPEKLKVGLPDFVATMKEQENKFITYNEKDPGLIEGRVKRLSSGERKFLMENYVPIGVRGIRAVGREFDFGPGQSLIQEAEIFVPGDYRVIGEKIVIDSTTYTAGDVLFLEKGIHEFRGTEKVKVRWDWEGYKNIK